MHHFAHHGGRFVQCRVRVTTLASRRIERRFSQTIIEQDKATVRLHTELCQANGLGPKIEADQARCDSHGLAEVFNRLLRFPNPKLKSHTKFQARNLKRAKSRRIPLRCIAPGELDAHEPVFSAREAITAVAWGATSEWVEPSE